MAEATGAGRRSQTTAAAILAASEISRRRE
jgi:hypothetical protein